MNIRQRDKFNAYPAIGSDHLRTFVRRVRAFVDLARAPLFTSRNKISSTKIAERNVNEDRARISDARGRVSRTYTYVYIYRAAYRGKEGGRGGRGAPGPRSQLYRIY